VNALLELVISVSTFMHLFIIQIMKRVIQKQMQNKNGESLQNQQKLSTKKAEQLKIYFLERNQIILNLKLIQLTELLVIKNL